MTSLALTEFARTLTEPVVVSLEWSTYHHDRSRLPWEARWARPRCLSCGVRIADGSAVHMEADGMRHKLCFFRGVFGYTEAERAA